MLPLGLALSSVRRVATICLALSCLLLSSTGWAQSIQSILPAAFDRKNPQRVTAQKPFWINRQDCLDDDELYFDMSVIGPTDDNFQVWVGTTDCSPLDQRTNQNGQCWLVYNQLAQEDRFTVALSVRDIVAGRPSPTDFDARGTGTESVCARGWELNISIYFMYVNDAGNVQASQAWSQTGVDTEGPTPPTNVEAGLADSALYATWDPSNATDLLGYEVFCAPVGSVLETADAGASTGTGGSGDAGLSGACYADGFQQGVLPPAELVVCGETTGTTADGALVRGVDIGQEYVIAVAATDELGNPGPLSNVSCQTTKDLVTFFEQYREDGGGGGGGICGVSIPGQTNGAGSGKFWLGIAAGLAGLLLSRRRR